MRLDEIKAAVGSEVHDLDALYAQFEDEAGGQADPDQFLAYLRRENQITDSRFRELHTRGTLVLKSLSTLATHVFGEDAEEDAEPVGEPIRYTYLGRIGHGAMGEVQIARDHVLQRKVAVKRMHGDLPKPRRMAARFLTEAQITAQLDHPNIVPVYALERAHADAPLSYTMKLIRGRTFEEVVAECRADVDAHRATSSSLDERLEHFLKVCDAMAYAHSRGVVHRDLKPENIMVGPFNEVYVMDWGIARVMDGTAEGVDDLVELPPGETHRTRAGTVIGTPAYMSPEQAEGLNETLDGRSDQFSLGLILYELVSLTRAVEGETADELMARIQVRRLRQLRPYGKEPIPTELAAIIDKATALDPENRYPDVASLAADIRRYRKGEAVSARQDTPRQRINRWVTRHRELVLLSLVALLCVIFLVVIGFAIHNNRIRDAAERREERLSALINAVGRQGHMIDGHLQHYEDVVNVFARSVEAALDGRVPPTPAYAEMAEDFQPPDLGASARYGRDVSFGYPVFSVAEPVDRAAATPQMDRIAGATRAFSEALLRSESDEAPGLLPQQQRKLLGEGDGVPLAWASVALDDGLFATYPGHGGFAPGYDARKSPWFRIDRDLRGPQWGSPYIDLSGLGLVLPCTVALRDANDAVTGVASVRLTFDYLIDHLLLPADTPEGVEGFLVDEDGRIVIQSSEERAFGERKYTRSLRLKRFPVPDLVAAIDDRDSGYLEAGGELMLFYRMNAIGWYYVLKGDSATLLE